MTYSPDSVQQESANAPQLGPPGPSPEVRTIPLPRVSLRVWLPLVAGLGLAAFSAWLAVWPGVSIAKGVSVNGIDLGGQSLASAASILAEYAKESLSDKVVIEAPNLLKEVSLSDLGGRLAVREAAEDAYSITREGGFFSRIAAKLQSLFGHKTRLSIGIALDGNKAAEFLTRLDKQVRVEPTSASITLEYGQIVKTSDKPGRRIGLDAALRRLAAVVPEREPARVAVPSAQVGAPVTAADLADVDCLLAGYSTSLGSSSHNRVRNLELACKMINGTLLRPGEVFSYNKVVGPRLESLGFREAPIYRNGEVVPGTGGGVCQVSTTIYNIALLTDSEILQRSHHSMPVHYVPLGRDATVAYPGIDLRFRNTGSHPMYLEAKVSGWRIRMRAFGASSDKKDVRIRSSVVRSYPAKVFSRDDPSLPVGATRSIRKAVRGYKVVVTKQVATRLGETRPETVSRDFYRPVAGLQAVGTREVVPEPAVTLSPPDEP